MVSPISLTSQSAPLAVVTGAASGIGRSLTRALLARGHDVVAIDRHSNRVDPRAHGCSLDVRDAAGMAELAHSFAGRPVSHVFANAGIGGVTGDGLGLADEAWRWAWEVNFLSALRTLRLWWPHLCAGKGKAVATLSSAALTSFPGAGPYRASKAALLSAMEGLFYQAKGTGVSVHALCPGMVQSEIGDVDRYPEGRALRPAEGVTPNPFAAHVAEAMRTAEPASVFAERVLQGLDAGAPFYWLTHRETSAWIEARHRAIEHGGTPFSDFGVPA